MLPELVAKPQQGSGLYPVNSRKLLTIKDYLGYTLGLTPMWAFVVFHVLLQQGHPLIFEKLPLGEAARNVEVSWLTDVVRLSERREVIQRTLARAELPRLQKESLTPLEPVAVSVCGGQTPRGRPGTRMVMQGTVQRVCQRCLQSVEVKLDVQCAVEWVRGEAELDAADQDDEWDAMLLTDTVDLLPLVEDELLLAIPYAPMHSSCVPAGPSEAGDKPSPFAMLARLKTGG